MADENHLPDLARLTSAAACEGSTFRLAALAGIASLYADLSCMAFAVVVIGAVRSFAVN